MPLRISNIERDLPRLNRELQRLDRSDRLDEFDSQLERVRRDLTQILVKREPTSTNNIIITWDGPNLKVTWAAAYVRDNKNKYYPIPAGERTGLAASTIFWAAWNPVHQSMAISSNLQALTDIKLNLLLCSFRTGTAVQTASAGGGGTDTGGHGRSSKEYLLLP